MGVSGTTIAIKEERKCLHPQSGGRGLRALSSAAGDTLDALQYLTGLVANRVDNAWLPGHHRHRQLPRKREKPYRPGHEGGWPAARTGRRTSLEPMNPYERRIIHTAVQEVEGVTSWSVGSEPNRHVVIGPSDDNPAKAKAPRSGSSRSGRGARSPARRRRRLAASGPPVRNARPGPPPTCLRLRPRAGAPVRAPQQSAAHR